MSLVLSNHIIISGFYNSLRYLNSESFQLLFVVFFLAYLCPSYDMTSLRVFNIPNAVKLLLGKN